MCWTFIIQYGTRVFMAEGMDEQAAEVLSQKYNIAAMILFVTCRFLCTWLMKYLKPSKLLTIFAIGGMIATAGVIFLQNRLGLYCLVAVSGFMSLMFPTIYGIALGGLGDDAKFGAAGLIMAILGGSVLPPLQAWIIDKGTIGFLPAVNASFILPFICFIVVCFYGIGTVRFIWQTLKNRLRIIQPGNDFQAKNQSLHRVIVEDHQRLRTYSRKDSAIVATERGMIALVSGSAIVLVRMKYLGKVWK